MYGRYLDVIEQPWIVFYHDGMEFIEVRRVYSLLTVTSHYSLASQCWDISLV